MTDMDRAGIALLKRIVDKYVEPLDGPGDKTVGEWRKELAKLHMEAVNYFLTRHAKYGKETFEDEP